jgi:hypothetical protein
MSVDGAHMGVSADRALETILGGKPSPSADEQMDAETFRKWILSADNADSYGEAARLGAKYVLEFLTDHPEYDRAHNTHEIFDATVEAHPEFKPVLDEFTGFMVGWSVNAARRCLELPPLKNPAVIS